MLLHGLEGHPYSRLLRGMMSALSIDDLELVVYHEEEKLP